MPHQIVVGKRLCFKEINNLTKSPKSKYINQSDKQTVRKFI